MNTLNANPERLPTENIVHAGALLLEEKDGRARLKSYLIAETPEKTVLVHRGRPDLHELADEAHVPEISTGKMPAGNSEEIAAEFAIARGAERLDFAIGEMGVRSVHGTPIRWLAVRDAMRLSQLESMDERVRAKLKAGCLALKEGIARVRIGNPMSLRRDTATELVTEPPLNSLPEPDGLLPKPWEVAGQLPLPVRATHRALSSVEAATSTRHTPWRRRTLPWELGPLRLSHALRSA